MSERLSEQVRTNFTPDELRQLRDRATSEHRPVANVVRLAVLAYLNGGKAK